MTPSPRPAPRGHSIYVTVRESVDDRNAQRLRDTATTVRAVKRTVRLRRERMVRLGRRAVRRRLRALRRLERRASRRAARGARRTLRIVARSSRRTSRVAQQFARRSALSTSVAAAHLANDLVPADQSSTATTRKSVARGRIVRRLQLFVLRVFPPTVTGAQNGRLLVDAVGHTIDDVTAWLDDEIDADLKSAIVIVVDDPKLSPLRTRGALYEFVPDAGAMAQRRHWWFEDYGVVDVLPLASASASRIRSAL